MDDDYIEIMVRLIWEGAFTPRLIVLKKGNVVSLEGPYGFFTIRNEEITRKHYYLIATGVGISPFLSFIRSYKDINYTLLHGVRHGYEAYRHNMIPYERRILCTSRDQSGNFYGRVTGYLKEHTDLIPESVFYLCGNSNMIEQVTELLENWGIDPFDIRQEVFF